MVDMGKINKTNRGMNRCIDKYLKQYMYKM